MSQDTESLYWNPITQSNLSLVYVEITTADGVPSVEDIDKTDVSYNVVQAFAWPAGTKIHAEAKAIYSTGEKSSQTFTLATGDFVVGQDAAPVNLGVTASACAPPNIILKVVIAGFMPISGPANPPEVNDTYELDWSPDASNWFFNKDNGEDQPQTSITCSCSDGQYDVTIEYGSPGNQTGPIALNSGGSFINPVNGWSGLWSGTGTAALSISQ